MLWLGQTGARGGGGVAGSRLPRRRLASVGQTWPSGLHLGRGQALEVERDTANSSRGLRRLIRVWVGAPHDRGGAGSRWQGERARAEGEGKRERAQRDTYHPRVLRRRLETGDWRHRGGIGVAQGSVDGGAALGSSGGMAVQGHGGAGRGSGG
jgi:hypothetical protein